MILSAPSILRIYHFINCNTLRTSLLKQLITFNRTNSAVCKRLHVNLNINSATGHFFFRDDMNRLTAYLSSLVYFRLNGINSWKFQERGREVSLIHSQMKKYWITNWGGGSFYYKFYFPNILYPCSKNQHSVEGWRKICHFQWHKSAMAKLAIGTKTEI